jgi:acyl-CoA thioesterase 8
VARDSRKEVKVDEDVRKDLRNGDDDEKKKQVTPLSPPPPLKEPKPIVSMMVSLDHTIYFHNPRNFRADEWLFTEMESPWSGDGRGLVLQKIFTQKGELIATCVQEVIVHLLFQLISLLLTFQQGVVRLKQDAPKI